ncbi:MAG TPA: restriction endonuclease subunit S [Longimicrobium sp.]|nr:restriction endonuclease subunit S [Longimicrobium sp.]
MSGIDTVNTSLPAGWVAVTVGSIADLRAGYGFPTSLQGKRTGKFPFYKVGDISSAWKNGSRTLLEAQHFIDEEELSLLRAVPLPAGATVFAKIGAAIGLNRRAMVDRPSLVDNNVFALIPADELVEPRFLFYYTWTMKLGDSARATTVPSLRKEDVESIRFPLPPHREQVRIVQALEEKLSKIAASIGALLRVTANLKRYRASVLKAACEGRLVPTEAELARREGRDYEPACKLLDRIGVPALAGHDALVESTPEGWAWATLGSIADLQGGITKGQSAKPGQTMRSVPYLRVANVQRGYLDLSEVKVIDAPESKIEILRLLPGDILFNEGGDRDKLGRGWIWNGQIEECIHQNHVFRARVKSKEMDPRFISWFGNSLGQKYFMDEGKQTTNLASINITKLGALPVLLPPVAEQQRIVAEVERRLSTIDQLEAEVARGLRRAERLRQSILKRAFEGKLVPQDPNDEPASVLLERILAARAGQASTPRKRRTAAK